MAQDVRSSVAAGNTSFDFNSQAGVLRILQAIRASDLAITAKNDLRDLVFLYANGGGDQATRNMLEERLRSNNISPALVSIKEPNISKEQTTIQPVAAGFANSRPAPVFISKEPKQSATAKSPQDPIPTNDTSPTVKPTIPPSVVSNHIESKNTNI